MSSGTVAGKDPKLFGRVGEETDPAVTGEPVLAGLGAVAGRVEPALENAVSELAGVALGAVTFAEIRAGRTRIVVLPRVPTTGLLARVGVRALSPVM